MKISDIIICINNVGYPNFLTKGKKYTIIELGFSYVTILNNHNIRMALPYDRFITIQEHRLKKLERII